MKPYFGIIVMGLVLCGLAITGRARIATDRDISGIPSIAPDDFQPIRATVVDKTPSHFTIDVKNFANITADENAGAFAVYIENTLPAKCGDFRYLDLPYRKPSEYTRVFNLSRHPEVLKAIRVYGCVITNNSSGAIG